jgi:hypothetical protein
MARDRIAAAAGFDLNGGVDQIRPVQMLADAAGEITMVSSLDPMPCLRVIEIT